MGNKIIGSILAPPRIGAAVAGLTCVSAVAFSSSGAYANTVDSGLQVLSGTSETNSVTVTTGEPVGLTTIPTATGSLAVGKGTVKVATNSGGYQLYISGPNVGTNGYTSLYYEGDENADINDEIRGIPTETPMPFASTNQWGYAVKSNGANGFSTEATYEAAISVGSTADTGIISGLNWRGITKNMSLVRTSATGDTDTTAAANPIYYAIYVDNNLMTGEYRNTIIYTAFVDGANKLVISPSQIKDGETMTITSEYMSSDNPITSSSQINVKLLDGEDPVGTCDNINIQRDGKDALLKFSCTVHTNASFEAGKAYDATVELSIPGRGDVLSFHADDAWGNGVMKDGAKMQDMVAASCKNAETGATYRLKDSRDDKSYLVSKLADGNCWMVQNLALDSGTTEATRRTITSTDSDVAADYTLPISSTTGFSDNTEQYMFNGGKGDAAKAHKDNTYDDKDSNTGAYYSWLVATANSGAGLTEAGAEASYSICPKGWRLPSGGASGQFKNLYTVNGGTFAGLNSVWHGALVGDYSNSSLDYHGTYGYWWSRTAYDSDLAYSMYQSSSSFYPEHYGYKRVGRSVRCVLDTHTMQDFTKAEADALAEDETIHLIDTRDNKSYLVTKLKDGNVWMTQNLALEGGTTITPANSNVKANYTLPTSSTSGFNDNTKAYMYNGSTHQNNTTNNKDTHTGAYYSWLAAIAKNDANYSAADMTALETGGAQAAYSICPKNWRLPLRDNGMIAVKNMYSLDEFRTLWNQGVTGTAPLVGVYNGSSLDSSGSYADWWSRESNSATGARDMYQNSSGFYAGSYNRYVGISVRCVLGV